MKGLKKIGYRRRCALFSFLCVLPWLVCFLVFSAKPLADSVIYSFCRTSFRPDATIKLEFVGLDNFRAVLIDWNDFWEAFFDYAYQIGLMLPVVVIFSLLIAILLNAKIPGRGILRAVFFLPVVLMQGPLMSIVTGLKGMSISGIDSMFVFSFISSSLPDFLSVPLMYIVRQFVVIIWYSGVQILICLAGLQKQDRNMYEAAFIDGASSWQVFWKITLPVSRPFILLSAVYTVVDISTADINPFIALIKDNMYTKSSGFGFPSAITWLYFFIVLAAAGIVALLLRSREKKGALAK